MTEESPTTSPHADQKVSHHVAGGDASSRFASLLRDGPKLRLLPRGSLATCPGSMQRGLGLGPGG